MDSIVRLPARERADIFAETAAKLAMTPAITEKDFWVTWVLHRLFADPVLSKVLIFKGGTSLSKAYGLIERFSEDIDLILDWRVLKATDENPLAERSKSKQEKLNQEITKEARACIAGDLLARVQTALSGICQCEISVEDPHVINVRYPASFPDTYLRPEVRLEIGPLAAWLPHENRVIRSYAAKVFAHLFAEPDCIVRVISAERTFWEKATILHHEAHRPEDGAQPLRYSRHYYDLAMMAASPVKQSALTDLDLLADVVAFKQRFYPRGWARYDLATPGTLKLVPPEAVLTIVEKDYRAMRNMIFGEVLDFKEVMKRLHQLEVEINQGSHIHERGHE